MVGQTISHYKIVEKLGEGGMGVVYRAEDTKLRRNVALKFLSREALYNEEVAARLMREAQAAAALDHPNICAVHGIHEEQGEIFIAMAYVDGQSLADNISERPMPLNEALDIAVQIADGLREAHDKGIVHRDVKPQNVMLTAKGQPKLMDFGLASLTGRSKLTKSGTTLGTPAYMAPEQLERREVDRRADIWALGCVLYEMLTQKTPFDADYDQAIAYGILNEDPEPVTALRSGLPTEIDRVIGKALAKDPADRYQHADDLLVDLRRLKGVPPSRSDSKAPVASAATKSYALIALTAFVLCATGLALGWYLSRSADAEVQSYQLELNAPPGVAYTAFALSPDGSRVAFIDEGTGSPRLWVQSLVDRSARAIEGSESADPVGTPFWSPDGAQIGFFANGKLKRVAIEGGGVQTLCDAAFGRGGSWNADGVIVFAPTANSGLWRTSFSTTGCNLFVVAEERQSFRNPQFLPDGGSLLATHRVQGGSSVVHVPLEERGHRTVAEGLPHALYVQSSATGREYLLYAREGSLWVRPFDWKTLSIEEPEIPIATDVGSDFMLGRGLVSVAAGVLAYLPEGVQSRTRELGWFDRAGKLIRRVTAAETFGFSLDLSSDEKWAIYWQNNPSSAGRQISRLDLSTGIATSIATGVLPALGTMGDSIFYTSAEGLVVEPSSGGLPRVIVRAGEGEQSGVSHSKFFCDTSRDGSSLLYQDRSPRTGWDLWTVRLAGGEPQPFLNEPHDEGQAKISPNGRWLVYVSNESGRPEIYARAYPSAGRKERLSQDGGHSPRWRSDGAEIFYVDLTGMLTAMKVDAVDGEAPRFGHRQPLFPVSSTYINVENYVFAPSRTYDVSQDGQRFLALWRPADLPFPPLRVITNWERGLGKR